MTDINLKYYDGTAVKNLFVTATGGLALRIRKGGTNYGIPFQATPVTISGTTDAYVSTASPDTNYGTTGTLPTIGQDGAGKIRRALFEFDVLSAVPGGATIHNATLVTNAYDDRYTKDARVYRVAEVWDEATVTWNNQPTFVTTGSAAPTITGPGYIYANVTSIVAWQCANSSNNGMLMKQFDEATKGSWDLYSCESAYTYVRPWLTIHWATANTSFVRVGTRGSLQEV